MINSIDRNSWSTIVRKLIAKYICQGCKTSHSTSFIEMLECLFLVLLHYPGPWLASDHQQLLFFFFCQVFHFFPNDVLCRHVLKPSLPMFTFEVLMFWIQGYETDFNFFGFTHRYRFPTGSTSPILAKHADSLFLFQGSDTKLNTCDQLLSLSTKALIFPYTGYEGIPEHLATLHWHLATLTGQGQ